VCACVSLPRVFAFLEEVPCEHVFPEHEHVHLEEVPCEHVQLAPSRASDTVVCVSGGVNPKPKL
jgi:hypothetical protein